MPIFQMSMELGEILQLAATRSCSFKQQVKFPDLRPSAHLRDITTHGRVAWTPLLGAVVTPAGLFPVLPLSPVPKGPLAYSLRGMSPGMHWMESVLAPDCSAPARGKDPGGQAGRGATGWKELKTGWAPGGMGPVSMGGVLMGISAPLGYEARDVQ